MIRQLRSDWNGGFTIAICAELMNLYGHLRDPTHITRFNPSRHFSSLVY